MWVGGCIDKWKDIYLFNIFLRNKLVFVLIYNSESKNASSILRFREEPLDVVPSPPTPTDDKLMYVHGCVWIGNDHPRKIHKSIVHERGTTVEQDEDDVVVVASDTHSRWMRGGMRKGRLGNGKGVLNNDNNRKGPSVFMDGKGKFNIGSTASDSDLSAAIH